MNASVGFQCPECAKGGPKVQRGRDVIARNQRPVLTEALIAVNAAILLASIAQGGSSLDGGGSLTTRLGLAGPFVADGEWWRIITSGFMHAGLIHLAFNMYALYSLGGLLERVIGRARFAAVYGVSLVGGSLGALVLSPNALTVGASGAVFGVFAAFAVLQRSRGMSPWANGIGLTIGLNLVFTFTIPGISAGGHLGGLIAGALVGAILIGIDPTQAGQRDRMLKVTIPAAVGFGVVLFGLAVVAAHAA